MHKGHRRNRSCQRIALMIGINNYCSIVDRGNILWGFVVSVCVCALSVSHETCDLIGIIVNCLCMNNATFVQNIDTLDYTLFSFDNIVVLSAVEVIMKFHTHLRYRLLRSTDISGYFHPYIRMSIQLHFICCCLMAFRGITNTLNFQYLGLGIC